MKINQIDRTRGQTDMKAEGAGLRGGGQDGVGISELVSPAPVLGCVTPWCQVLAGFSSIVTSTL